MSGASWCKLHWHHYELVCKFILQHNAVSLCFRWAGLICKKTNKPISSSLDVTAYVSCCTCRHWCVPCSSDTLFKHTITPRSIQNFLNGTSPQCPVSHEEQLLQQYHYSCWVLPDVLEKGHSVLVYRFQMHEWYGCDCTFQVIYTYNTCTYKHQQEKATPPPPHLKNPPCTPACQCEVFYKFAMELREFTSISISFSWLGFSDVQERG